MGDYTFHLGKALEQHGDVFYLNRFSSNFTKPIKTWSLSNLITLNKAIKKIKPDLISLQYVPYGYQSIGLPFGLTIWWVLLKLKGYQLQVTFHEIAISLTYKRPKHKIIALLQRFIAAILCWCAQDVFTSTLTYKKMLLPYSSKVKQVFIGSNIPMVGKVNSIKRMASVIELVSFANRISSELLSSLLFLKEKNINFVLNIVGKPQKEITKLCEPTFSKLATNLRWCGILSEIELSNLFLNADIYLQIENITSQNKGGVSLKSGALMAALSHGLPVITKKGILTEEKWLNEANGIFFSNDYEDLNDKIVFLIHDAETRKLAGVKAKIFYDNYCSWSNIADAYYKLLR